MTLDSAIRRARAAYATVMDCTVTVRRAATDGAYSPSTHQWTPGGDTVVYTGMAIVRPAGGDTPGEQGAVREGDYTVKLPADSDVRRGDSITVVSSTHDQGLVGSTLWALEADLDSWQTVRVVRCSTQQPEV